MVKDLEELGFLFFSEYSWENFSLFKTNQSHTNGHLKKEKSDFSFVFKMFNKSCVKECLCGIDFTKVKKGLTDNSINNLIINFLKQKRDEKIIDFCGNVGDRLCQRPV